MTRSWQEGYRKILNRALRQVIHFVGVRRFGEAQWALWDKVCADDRIAVLAETEAIDAEFRRFSRLRSSSPKVWADAYLVAFATVAGLKLVTFDRGLRSLGADVHVL